MTKSSTKREKRIEALVDALLPKVAAVLNGLLKVDAVPTTEVAFSGSALAGVGESLTTALSGLNDEALRGVTAKHNVGQDFTLNARRREPGPRFGGGRPPGAGSASAIALEVKRGSSGPVER